jgi:hypothetical protein
MSNYTKGTDFAAKDDLLTGDPAKIVRGSEIDDEFNAIQVAVNSKPDTTTVNTLLQAIYPVGSIYINAGVTTNPASLIGFGTWVEFGAGKVLVGLDAGDTSFDTLEETGGSKDAIVVSHTHSFSGTTSTDGSHNHLSPTGDEFAAYGTNGIPSNGPDGLRADGRGYTSTSGSHSHTISGTTGSTGSSGTNANLQPYVVVKMWKRTA